VVGSAFCGPFLLSLRLLVPLGFLYAVALGSFEAIIRFPLTIDTQLAIKVL